jgi:hypothetical protein
MRQKQVNIYQNDIQLHVVTGTELSVAHGWTDECIQELYHIIDDLYISPYPHVAQMAEFMLGSSILWCWAHPAWAKIIRIGDQDIDIRPLFHARVIELLREQNII